jgi:hypothetical protein
MTPAIEVRSECFWTSGGKGLHMVVPLAMKHDYDLVNRFAKAVVEHLARVIRSGLVAKGGASNHVGKLFVDYLRNGRGATTAATFSARAPPGLGASMAVSWDDLSGLKSADQWTITTAREHLSFRRADPWASYWKSRQTLTKASRRLASSLRADVFAQRRKYLVEFVEVERLLQVVVNDAEGRHHIRVRRRMTRYRDENNVVLVLGAQMSRKIMPIHSRHPHIENNAVGNRGGNQGERARPIGCRSNGIAVCSQMERYDFSYFGGIIDHENAYLIGASHGELPSLDVLDKEAGMMAASPLPDRPAPLSRGRVGLLQCHAAAPRRRRGIAFRSSSEAPRGSCHFGHRALTAAVDSEE